MPLRPSSETISPRPVVRDTPNKTRLNPYLVSTLLNSRRQSELAMRQTFAEIGFAHSRIGANSRRIAGRDYSSINQNADAVSERKDCVDVVFDQNNGDNALERTQHLQQASGFLKTHPGHGLIKQQHSWPSGKRHCDLQLAPLAVAKVGNKCGGTFS